MRPLAGPKREAASQRQVACLREVGYIVLAFAIVTWINPLPSIAFGGSTYDAARNVSSPRIVQAIEPMLLARPRSPGCRLVGIGISKSLLRPARRSSGAADGELYEYDPTSPRLA